MSGVMCTSLGITAQELECKAVSVCATLMEVLAVFSPSLHNQCSLLVGGAVGCVIQCMTHPALREGVWLVERG